MSSVGQIGLSNAEDLLASDSHESLTWKEYPALSPLSTLMSPVTVCLNWCLRVCWTRCSLLLNDRFSQSETSPPYYCCWRSQRRNHWAVLFSTFLQSFLPKVSLFQRITISPSFYGSCTDMWWKWPAWQVIQKKLHFYLLLIFYIVCFLYQGRWFTSYQGTLPS